MRRFCIRRLDRLMFTCSTGCPLCERHPPSVADLKGGISVGTANCFLSAAYSLSPIIAGGVIQKARACMCVPGRALCSPVARALLLLPAESSPSAAKHPRAATSACAGLQVAATALLVVYFFAFPCELFSRVNCLTLRLSAKILRAELGEMNLPFTASAKVFVLRS